MNYLLIIILSTGSVGSLSFTSPKACDEARKALIMSTVPKMQTAFCIEQPQPEVNCAKK